MAPLKCRISGGACPVDYNEREGRYNWELIYCELYAGGKYQNNEGENYEFSLGLNGLGACATQYSSEYMDVDLPPGRLAVHPPFSNRGRT